MDIHVSMPVLHTALTQRVTYGLVIVCVHLDIKEKDARTISVFVVIQGTNINSMHIILKKIAKNKRCLSDSDMLLIHQLKHNKVKTRHMY